MCVLLHNNIASTCIYIDHQFDVLFTVLEENAYVEQPSGMSANIQPVCYLHVSVIKTVFQVWSKT